MIRMVEVTYTCAKCGATDTPRFFPSEPIPPAVNCYKCHAGFQKDLQEMLMSGSAMFPPKHKAAA